MKYYVKIIGSDGMAWLYDGRNGEKAQEALNLACQILYATQGTGEVHFHTPETSGIRLYQNGQRAEKIN